MWKLNEHILPVNSRAVTAAMFSFLTILSANAEVRGEETAATAATAPPVTAEMGADGVQRLSLTLDSYSFSPSYIIVQAGKPVEFSLKNVASVAPHSLNIDASKDGLFVSQDVEPGQTATIQFTPVKVGVYEFYCDKKLAFFPSHRKKGMVGKLEVR